MASPVDFAPQSPQATWQTVTDALSPPRRNPAHNTMSPANEHTEGRDYHEENKVDDYKDTFQPRSQPPRTPAPNSRLMPYQPDSPSPLRHLVDENISPSTPRLPDTPTNTYEVPGSFLNAMVGLLERQARIVPEHLYTEDDMKAAREEVRHHMLARFEAKQAAQNEMLEKKKEELQLAIQAALDQVNKTAMDEMQMSVRKLEGIKQTLDAAKETNLWVGTMMNVIGTVSVVVLGASIGVIRSAFSAHPENALQLVNGAWKGGACGLVGILLFKGMLEAFDGRRGIYI